jgi:tRNA(fMet)-specific endonuclease VapC
MILWRTEEIKEGSSCVRGSNVPARYNYLHLRHQQKPANVLGLIKEKSRQGIYISSLTVAELEYGVENSSRVEGNRIALLKFISLFDVLKYDASDAIRYGKLRASLRKAGKMIGPIDMLLGSQALSKDLIFVTNNVDESSRIEGLIIEDWSKAGPEKW